MKPTKRKLAARRMTGRAGPAPVPPRPLLADAPQWFNRARALANQRQTCGMRPVPLGQSCFVPHGGINVRRRIHIKAFAIGVSLVVLPAVFLIGFWTHGLVAPAQLDLVNSGAGHGILPAEPVQVVAARDRQHDLAQKIDDAPTPALIPGAPPAEIDGTVRNLEQSQSAQQPSELARRRQPRPSTIAANSDTAAQPHDQIAQVASVAAAPGLSGEPDALKPVDRFALRSPVAGQFVADVQVPGNSWFSLAGATADCESGTCKVVPVKRADRKLNTALEWSATPEQAAEQAAREGKLVFLIHVSGNFSQPGFT